jgi:hypothetical protein
MKTAIHISIFVLILTGGVCTTPPSLAAALYCQENYFSPDDFNHERSLSKPYPEFMESLRLAKAGNAMEQRNVAVSYDVGYMVSSCPEKAYYWYQEAAHNGDLIAKDWITRYNIFKGMFEGPEFAIKNEPPKVLASASMSTKTLTSALVSTKNGNAVGGQQMDPSSPLEKYNDYQKKLADPTSDYGKLAKVGQLLGSLLSK